MLILHDVPTLQQVLDAMETMDSPSIEAIYSASIRIQFERDQQPSLFEAMQPVEVAK